MLDNTDRKLELRFFNALPPRCLVISLLNSSPLVSLVELNSAVPILPPTTPGPDSITPNAVKSPVPNHLNSFLGLVNHWLCSSWISPWWKFSKIVTLQKTPSRGLQPDNWPISLTAILVRIIYRIRLLRKSDFFTRINVPSLCQTRFGPGWFIYLPIFCSRVESDVHRQPDKYRHWWLWIWLTLITALKILFSES